MDEREIDHALEFLLAFDGRIHHLEEGYWIKFEIKRVDGGRHRPHGLSYSLTLHAPDGTRLVGFDNAHGVGSRQKRRARADDHWHRGVGDSGRPYRFRDAETLIDDFFAEVEHELNAKGIGTTVTGTEEAGDPQ